MPGGRPLKRAGQPAAKINDRRLPRGRYITRLTRPLHYIAFRTTFGLSGTFYFQIHYIYNRIQMASKNSVSFFARLSVKIRSLYRYCTQGVWSDPLDNWRVRTVKTLNLTLSALFNSSLQNKSMALTYSTVLSIVPALALLVAIGRGFGFQDVMQTQLYDFFPSQITALHSLMRFVDSYLTSATQGVFVGVGIIVLLWTLISLLSSIEATFNSIWGVKQDRSFFQKITDYIAICLLIPVLLICSSGVSIFMSSVIQDNVNLSFLTPVLNIILEFLPLALCWLAFTLTYLMVPNTKVEFKYAAWAAVFSAVSFQILQLLFVNGTIYVSKYNAIYGSFAFLPLLLVWLQLSWLVLLTGCMLAYSMQNVFTFNLMGDERTISNVGWHNVALIVMAVVCRRFLAKKSPLSTQQIAVDYNLPIRIVNHVTERLLGAGLLFKVEGGKSSQGLSPAVSPDALTIGAFLKTFDSLGVTDFMSDFKTVYADYAATIAPLREKAYEAYGSMLVADIPVPTPAQVHRILAGINNVA